MQPHEISEILNRPISQELLARDLIRLAYIAKDGTPRNVPIGFTWNRTEIVMCTSKNAPKLPALRQNPAVALTIDTEVHPPKILLIRGQAELDVGTVLNGRGKPRFPRSCRAPLGRPIYRCVSRRNNVKIRPSR